jgi:hypothetical protein
MSPARVITNVTVIFRLSLKPFMATFQEPRAAIVDLPTDTYEEGVWFALRTSSAGMLNSLILPSISEVN